MAGLDASLPEVAAAFEEMATAMRHEYAYLAEKASPVAAA